MGEDSIWIKKIAKLTKWLIISGALNVAFVFTLISFALPRKEMIYPAKFSLTPEAVAKENLTLLNDYFSYPFETLLGELENKELVQDGYMRRDLALSCLVSFYDFDLERALPKTMLQKRKIALMHNEGGERVEVQLYPGLDDFQFDAIRSFAFCEKWPLTSRGLFNEFSRYPDPPQSLKEAFFFTREFHLAEILFNHMATPLPKEVLLTLLLQGGWEKLASFSKRYPQLDQMTGAIRRDFLLDYVGASSSLAARLLIETDRDFVLRELDDERLSSVLAAIDEKTHESEAFFKELLYGLRSDHIRRLAGMKLYGLSGEVPPEPYDHMIALQRFVPEFFAKETREEDSSRAVRYHRVKEGDTLWHISRTYRVSVEELMRVNGLKSSYMLTVGKDLLIPEAF